MMKSTIVGIDVGSVSIGLAEIDGEGAIVRTGYRIHRGQVRETLFRMLSERDSDSEFFIAVTKSTPSCVRSAQRVDNQVAIIAAARRLHEQVRAVLNVGAEKFSLILFDAQGNYRSSRTNTSCAAGTGSFLDQQAVRLNLKNAGELSRIARRNSGQVPRIASRCAVFAKTDLIHAQQEGYSLEEICDGLCRGLAKNVVDTLFSGVETIEKVIFCGGVSKNRAVGMHISALTGSEIVVDDCSEVYGALGAAIRGLEDAGCLEGPFSRPESVIMSPEGVRTYAFEGLRLTRSVYPDFTGHERYDYRVKTRSVPDAVEVDVYEDLRSHRPKGVYLGVDIGSTSTKAVLMDEKKAVLAGLYTRTSGRPVDAVCALFEAADDLQVRYGLSLAVLGSGTTGSGRKLIGKIIGADTVVDEISAHAKAAAALNPEVDTIIEIGGQDSKFTTLKSGRVTFSVMNTVCAAGTGSFLEEQAKRMNCPLDEYSQRTLGIPSPLSSDRCTVFMERDMNYCLSEGYSSEEVLASALHAVCENYLTKVAVESMIGDVVLFQGATAKNKALVAAFEHRLGKPVAVSRFCHLAGAMGVALMLAEAGVEKSGFRGLCLYQETIPVRTEVCALCPNNCKLTVADIGGRSYAYGFLCGRDYETKRHVASNHSGFDLLKERKIAAAHAFPRQNRRGKGPTIGIPAALHLYGDLDFWRYFFDKLSIATVTSGDFRDAVKDGRHLAGAEFCAPVSALHGHTAYLLKKCDYVFVPFFFEEKTHSRSVRRQYCYYTQFAPSLVSAPTDDEGVRVLTPLIGYLYNGFHTKYQLYAMLRRIGHRVSFREVSHAYDSALACRDRFHRCLKDRCRSEMEHARDVQVVLLGRPYTVLNPSMNKGVIDIFASMGIPVYFQDMIDPGPPSDPSVQELLDDLPWKYESEIVRAADAVAGMEGVYPVLVTSFCCSPDAFGTQYFKNLMASRDKPYLILQLDEHDSNVGYETRIEAAVRSFRNHFSRGSRRTPVVLPSISPAKSFSNQTILIPDWDHFSCSLLAASLRREGIDAQLLDHSPFGLQHSLRYNAGECIPINIMAQEFMDHIVRHDLDPARCMLWMGGGEIPCNLKVIPHHIKNILNKSGPMMARAQVYRGDISFMDISLRAAMNAYFAFMFGGMLRKAGCRLRPYEAIRGSVDEIIEDGLKLLIDAFAGTVSKEDALMAVVGRLRSLPLKSGSRPLVAVFGDLYVRDNDAVNQGLIRFIEAHGGEVITTPYSSYAKMVARPYFRKWFNEGKYFRSLSSRAVLSGLTAMERKYYRHFQQVLQEPEHDFTDPVEDIIAPYRMIPEHSGETMDNVLKTYYIKKYYPDVALFIHASPAFCCPALVTEAMADRIESFTGVPVVSVTYDGTFGDKSGVIVPYLVFPRKPLKEESAGLILEAMERF